MIKVINIRDKVPDGFTVIYAGRPSPLGNPFTMHGEAKRNAVCDKYAEWFHREIGVDGELRKSIIDIYQRHMNGENIALQCFCKPKRCHCDTIKKFIDDLSIEHTLSAL